MKICGESKVLNGREWYFPEEIWERIMKTALFHDLLCWRTVCKRWNWAIVTEAWNSEENRQSQTTIPLIMRCRESSAADVALLALNPDYQKWFRMDIGHAVTFLHLYCNCSTTCLPCIQCTTIASLGLLILTCSCSLHWNSDTCLVIYNPVTMKAKPLIVPRVPAEYMVYSVGFLRLAGVIEGAGTNDKHYKLLFSTVYPDFIESFRVYCVYDSKTSSWMFGRGPVLSLPYIFSKASCGGRFYFLHRKVRYEYVHGYAYGRKRLVEPCMSLYDSETDTWSEIAWLPGKEEGVEYLPQLVECEGEIMYVARRRCHVRQRGPDYHMWAFFILDKSLSSLVPLWQFAPEFGSMPYALAGSSTEILRSYDVPNWFRQDSRCGGQADKVFFYSVQPGADLKHTVEQSWSSNSESTGPGMLEVKNGSVLLFDRKMGTWLSLPKYYPFQRDDNSSMYKLELFRPSLMEP